MNWNEAVCVGIDPGLDGAVVAIGRWEEGSSAFITPTLAQEKTTKRLYDIRAMVNLIEKDFCLGNILLVALEKGCARPGQGVSSMFRFGYGCGLWEGILAALRAPYVIVTPQKWQKVICSGLAGDPKGRAIAAAQARLPSLDLRKSDRSSKPHEGIADAACMALYAKHILSGGNEDA